MGKRVTMILVFLCMLLPASVLLADEIDSYGFGGFSIGANWLDIADLNGSLSSSPNNYATFNEPAVIWGFESYYALKKRFIFGGEFYALWMKETNTDYVQKLNSYWGTLDFGYSIFSKSADGFHLYPLVGLGASRMRLRVIEKDELNFSDIISDPKRESFLVKWDLITHAALGLDYAFTFSGDEEDEGGGFMLGVRVGYQYSITDSRWKMSGRDIYGSPGASMSGFYVRFVIGGLGYGDDFGSFEMEE